MLGKTNLPLNFLKYLIVFNEKVLIFWMTQVGYVLEYKPADGDMDWVEHDVGIIRHKMSPNSYKTQVRVEYWSVKIYFLF